MTTGVYIQKKNSLEKGGLSAGVKLATAAERRTKGQVLFFLCGDVMTGRGIDQILPHPSRPNLYEMCVKNAEDYVRLAEMKKGPLLHRPPVPFAYPWGDALPILDEIGPDVRVINLETSVTTSEESWPGKGIHYRMHPDNWPCIGSASIDCCVLANNHVLDWGHRGLCQTLDVLQGNGIRTAGAGRNMEEAQRAAIIQLDADRRVLVYGWAEESSGVPEEWAATDTGPGVNFMAQGIGKASVETICERIAKDKRPNGGDIVVLSIHWGPNWGYPVGSRERQFAHRLIDSGLVDIVHGHSSHHAKRVEIYRDKLILYGCGDFLNDYEGITGHDEYHDEFTLMYLPTVDAHSGKLVRMQAIPMLIEHMRLNRASPEAVSHLYAVMKRECAMGVQVEREAHSDAFSFTW